MKVTQLSERFSVSDQVHPEDIDTLAQAGVEILICNRPDYEAAEQPLFATIKEAAAKCGMEAVSIAFAGGEMNQQHVAALRKYLDSGKKIHAYCRTGNRSTKLWEACQPPCEAEQSSENSCNAAARYDVVIVGAGSAGVAVAASLLKRRPTLRLALVDPSADHYYQPGWTMVGGGVFDVKSTRRDMASVIPAGASWIQQAVESFAPEENKVLLADGSALHYEQLVVCPGLVLNWNAIEGLSETLGRNGVTSNYRYDLAPYTWELVSQLKGGRALFTQPPMPIKCAGAPQKALYLAADHWYRNGLLKNIEVHFFNAGAFLFGVADYVPALSKYMEKYQAQLNFCHNLVKIDGPAKMAWFKRVGTDGSETTIIESFNMIHVCPPQCAPAFIRRSPLADEEGWLDVDPASLRHKRVENIWGLGDVTNTTNAKTLAAVRKQVPVVAINIIDALDGKAPTAEYDGYGSCPLTVERGKIVLAEFTYGGKLAPTFPKWLNDGTRPTRFAWQLKAKVLPALYWHGMLKGHEWLTAPKRSTELA